MSFANQLTEAAEKVSRLVKSMTWFERHSPSPRRIEDHFKELERLLETYKNDFQLVGKKATHLDHIRYLHSLVSTLRIRSFDLEKELYTQLLVLDALENAPQEEE